MGKSPRKSTKSKQPSHPHPNSKTNSYVGGKNYRPYNINQNNPQRRFSIVDSSSSDSDNHHHERPDFSKVASKSNLHYGAVLSGSDSESSLTAVSENDDVEASRKGSVFFANNNIEGAHSNKNRRSYKTPGKRYTSRKSTSKVQNHNDSSDDDDDDNSDDNSDDDDSEEEQDLALGSIYNMMNNQKPYHNSDREEEEEEDDEENDFSSSDDSDIDFVQLQAERKAKSMKAVRAMKGLKKNKPSQNKKHQNQHHQHQNNTSSSDRDSNDDQSSDEDDSIHNDSRNKVAAKSYKNKRSGSVSRPKYGRRKSEAALPEDINFTFDFDDFNKFGSSAIDDDDDDDADGGADRLGDNTENDLESNTIDTQNESKVSEDSEEDIGEEVQFPESNENKSKSGNNAKDLNFEFNFDSPLVQVPRFKDDELNSDEDYEIDDNELLATLQADNDLEEFDGLSGQHKKSHSAPKTENKNDGIQHVRNNSMGSLNDDDENDPFLKEEEKFLVNEFENNGFDDENEDLNAEVEIDYNDESGRNSLIDSFNSMNAKPDKPVVQYASDDSRSDIDDDDDEEEDEYVDIMDFSVPFFEKLDHSDYNSNSFKSSSKNNRSGGKRSNKAFNSGNSDEEDDSYLWNYFFSSDNNSNGEEEEQENQGYGKSDEFTFNDDFHGDNGKFEDASLDKKQRRNSRRKSQVAQNAPESEEDYYSGDSTDVDESLPPSTQNSNFGSKMAKEVLSSKTADYRPPVLGTWMALDSKPFGIIDGLSTRTLNNISNTSNRNMEPKSKSRKSVTNPYPAAANTDDSALGLDELLNISELDNDDENDVRIWRDFNNQKKQVPLGAFRNKSILHNSMIHPDSLPIHYNQASRSNGNYNQRRSSTNGHRNGSVGNRSHVNGVVKKHNSHRKPTNTYHRPTSNQKAEHDQLTARMKRRRQSIAEAVAEGYRPTKSGVFSEHALADVEEVFGDDNDLMALIKGL